MTLVLAEPTPETWRDRFRHASEFQSDWRTITTELIELYELRWEVDGVPEDIPITRPSTPAAVIDEATDNSDFNPQWLSFRTPTYGLTEDAEKNASMLRSWCLGWLLQQLSHGNDVSPYRDWLKNLYLTGKAVYKVVYDHEQWPTASQPKHINNEEWRKLQAAQDAEREFMNPVVLRSIDPMAVYEEPTVGEKRWLIEAYDRTASEIQAKYESWAPEVLKADANPSRAVVLWDCYQIGLKDGVRGLWHQVLVNEMPDAGSFKSENVTEATQVEFMPREPFPYTIRFSGFGRQSSGRYEDKAKSLLYPVRSLLRAETRRETQFDAIIANYAWPTVFVTGSRSKVEVKWGPNHVNYIPPGTQVTIEMPNLQAAPIQAAMATLQAGIERGTFGSVVRGEKPANITSASQLALASGQARLRFGSVKIAQESALFEVLRKATSIVKHVIEEPVTIWQSEDADDTEPSKLQLKPDQIPTRFVGRIEILPDPVEEQERRSNLAAFLMEKGLIDVEEARERSGIRDTQAMKRRAIRDKVLLEDPTVLQALGARYVLESGIDRESLLIEKAMSDMLILRTQQDLATKILGQGGQGGSPAAPTTTANGPLGGRPTTTPTAGSARQRADRGPS